MKKDDLPILAGLAAFAVFIWLRDLRWWEGAGDTLPILVALPVFFWLGRPWQRRAGVRRRLAARPALLAAALFPVGIAVDSGLVQAASWTALLAAWWSARFVQPPGAFPRKLLLLPLLAFPWLITDGERIAWWFRLSGAAVTEKLLAACNVAIMREGTTLWSNGLAISVEPACSGVNGLQTMLIAGGALLYVKLRHSALFWWNLPLLAGVAWLAHLFRIVIAALCGVFLDPAAAARWVGPLHALAGWLGLVAAFLLCYGWFSLEVSWRAWTPAEIRRRARKLPWPGLALLAYAAFGARGLIDSWRWTPYDQLAWLAFALWLAPLFRPDASFGPAGNKTARARGLWLGACGLLLVGAAADINAIFHAAFAVVLAGFHRRHTWRLWLLGAVAWMPLAGWFGSRLGLDPAEFSLCRVVVAALAAVAGFGWWTDRVRTARPADKTADGAALLRGGARRAD